MDQLGFSLRSEEVWSDLTHTDTSAILFLSFAKSLVSSCSRICEGGNFGCDEADA
jgi:hypothetical protein